MADTYPELVISAVSLLKPQDWEDWEDEMQIYMKLSGIMTNLLVDPTAHPHY